MWGPAAWKQAFSNACDDGEASPCKVQTTSESRVGVHIEATTAIAVGTTIIVESASLVVPPLAEGGDTQRETDLDTEMRLHTLQHLLEGTRTTEDGGSLLPANAQAVIEGLCQPEFTGGDQSSAVDAAVELHTKDLSAGPRAAYRSLLLAVDCNAHAMANPKVASRVVFPTVCKLNHSCQANCALETRVDITNGEGPDSVPTVFGTVRVIRPILAGQEVTLNYLPGHYQVAPPRQRQAFLLRTKYFQCRCSSCTTPVASAAEGDAATGLEKETMTFLNRVFSGGGAKSEAEAAALRQQIEKLLSKSAQLTKEAGNSTPPPSLSWCSSSLAMLKCGMDAQMLTNMPFNAAAVVVGKQGEEEQEKAKSGQEGGNDEHATTWMMALGDCIKSFLEAYQMCVSTCNQREQVGASHEVLVSTTSNLLIVCEAAAQIPTRVVNAPPQTDQAKSWRRAHAVVLCNLVQVLSIHLLATLKAFGAGAKNVHAILGVWSTATSSFKPSLLSWLKEVAQQETATEKNEDENQGLRLAELTAIVGDLVLDDLVIETKGLLIPMALHNTIWSRVLETGGGSKAATAGGGDQKSDATASSMFVSLLEGLYVAQLGTNLEGKYSVEEGATEFKMDRFRCQMLLAARTPLSFDLVTALSSRMEPKYLDQISQSEEDLPLISECASLASARAKQNPQPKKGIQYLKGLVISVTEKSETVQGTGVANLKKLAAKLRDTIKEMK